MDREEPRLAGGTRTPGKATYASETQAWNPLLGRQAVCECAQYACVRVLAAPPPPAPRLPPFPHPPPAARHFPAFGGTSSAAFGAVLWSRGGGQRRLAERSQHRNVTSQGLDSSPSAPQLQSRRVSASHHLHFFLWVGGQDGGRGGVIPGPHCTVGENQALEMQLVRN